MKKEFILIIIICFMALMPNYNNYVDAASSTKQVVSANYTIKYNLNGGVNNKSNPVKYNRNTRTIKLKNPTKK